MSPNQRERDNARRRHEAWQARQQARTARRAQALRALLVAAATAAVAAVLVSVAVLAGPDGPEVAANPTVTATPSADPSQRADPDNPCPAPTSTPAAEQPQFGQVPDPAGAEDRTWTSTLQTSCGPVELELFGAEAPQAVASFVFLAGQGFFDGTPCHRLTTTGIFVLQCGDPTGTGSGGPGYSFGPIENAPADDTYPAGTLAMARVGGADDSIGSQFFIVYEDSTIPSDAAGGYTVFGRVTSGLDVVRQVADGGVGANGTAPARPVSIDAVSVR